MMNKAQKISCPKCGEEISIDDTLTAQIKAKVQKEFEIIQKTKESEFVKKTEELNKRTEELVKNEKNVDEIISEKLQIRLKAQEAELLVSAQKKAEKEQAEIRTLLEQQLKNKDEKLSEARQNELDVLKEKNKLKEEKETFELEKMKQLEEAKVKIVEEAKQKATEEQQYIIGQLKKQLTDATKAKDELARKLEQGSQQTQGEVLELELEELLKSEFIYDEILPVPKGISGADIIQKVYNQSRQVCGQIIWESKKTKSWSNGWIQKLKNDQRAIKADIAVIVSFTLPENVKGFAFKDGVWICEIKMAVALAISLRMNLEAISREKAMSVGKNGKMEILYSYLTGIEFKQRVEAIVEAFSSMNEGLIKERNAYEKIWAEREKQIKKVMQNTVGMYGDLSGLVALPQIKTLELEGKE